jgi:hypothetical protein
MLSRRDLLTAALTSAFGSLSAGVAGQPGKGQGRQNFRGEATLEKILSKAEAERWAATMPFGELVGTVAMQFVGTPYVGHTLELYDDREVCVVNLEGLDCVTLFESALGISRMLVLGERGPDALLKQVAFTRYRGGGLGDYTSRLHYTSDWFFDNERKGTIRNVTSSLPGATRFEKRIDFMSTNPDKYRQLKANADFVPIIRRQEEALMARETSYVPKSQVAGAEAKMQTGDIVGIVTSAQGIDCSHTGLGFRVADGRLLLLHASSVKKQVVLDVRLSEYLEKNSSSTGVMIARPVAPPVRRPAVGASPDGPEPIAP